MRNKDHRQPLPGKFYQCGEQFLFLIRGYACSRFIEDEHLYPQPEQSQNFQLLALTHGHCFNKSVRVDLKIKFVGEPDDLLFNIFPFREQSTLRSQQKIINHFHRWKIQWVLVQHTDPPHNRIFRGGDLDLNIVQQNIPRIRLVIAGEDLHQRAFSRAVLPQNSLDGAGRDDQVYVIICVNFSE